MAAYADLRSVERAYRACRRRKRGTVRACLYEQQLLDNLVTTRDALQAQSWRPGPPVVFTVTRPKAREVYAAQFEDRVVHHWLVEQLEAVIDRDFIHDAASNRKGRGTHFAVERLQSFMRRQGGKGWFLQLDIANFFNSIHRPTLLALLAHKLEKAVRRERMGVAQARLCYRIARRIILQPCAKQAIHLCTADEYRRVPQHKRLENAATDCGIPIGNLTSQFFANLYLNELDQFVKHTLKCRHYVRYVDDFILLGADRGQLVQWQGAITCFLKQRLRLQVKEGVVLAPLGNGADFLGYVVRPGYRLVRRRVVGNLHEKLAQHERAMVRRHANGVLLELAPGMREGLRATLASYWGHFRHANSFNLRQRLFRRFAWLHMLFINGEQLQPRWQPWQVSSMASQWRYFQAMRWAEVLLIQCGSLLLCNVPLEGATAYAGGSRITAWALPIQRLAATEQMLRRDGRSYAWCDEQGYLRGGLKRRVLRRLWLSGAEPPRLHS